MRAHRQGWQALDDLHFPGFPAFPGPGDPHRSLLVAPPHGDPGQVTHPLYASVYPFVSWGYYFHPLFLMEFLVDSSGVTDFNKGENSSKSYKCQVLVLNIY